MSDTEQLLATVREAHNDVVVYETGGYEDAKCYERFEAALDSLAAELERLRSYEADWKAAEDELERVKQKRDEWKRSYAEEVGRLDTALERVKAERDVAEKIVENESNRLDKALSALREIGALSEAKGGHAKYGTVARTCLAEIEGDPEWKQQKC